MARRVNAVPKCVSVYSANDGILPANGGSEPYLADADAKDLVEVAYFGVALADRAMWMSKIEGVTVEGLQAQLCGHSYPTDNCSGDPGH